MTDKPVFFLDSGIGGLPYVETARRMLPGESFYYLADRRNFPYGEKSPDQVISITRRIVAGIVRRFDPKALVIACNTAHYYYDAVQEAVDIPVIHLIGLVTDHIRRHFPDHREIGILASPAVNMTGLYAQKFAPAGLTDIWPEPDVQDQLLGVIKSVKKGDTGSGVVRAYQDVCAHLRDKGAGLAVVACTELSALDADLPVQAVDAAQILAREIVDAAKNRKKVTSYSTNS